MDFFKALIVDFFEILITIKGPVNLSDINSFGLFLATIGAGLIVYSVRVKRQYDGKSEKNVDKNKKYKLGLVDPTAPFIANLLLWFGLVFLVIGSILFFNVIWAMQ